MKSSNPLGTRVLGLTCAALMLAGLPACKRTALTGAALKGVTADQTAKSIDYARLLDADAKKARPLTFTFFFTYQEFPEDFQPSQGDPNAAKEDEATTQARAMLTYLTDPKNFPSLKEATLPPNTTKLELTGPVEQSEKIYVASYEGSGPETKGQAIHIDVVLGRALDAKDPAIAMPGHFADLLAAAFAKSDVSVFNGHIWEFPNGNDVHDTLTPKANTALLTSNIQSAGGRNGSYGVVFMNVCKSRFIEKKMIDVLGNNDVILLSNRYFNTYGNHARQSEYVLTDILARRPLQVLMAHTMYDLERQLTDDQQKELTGDDPDAAVRAAKRDMSGYLASIADPGADTPAAPADAPKFAPVAAKDATVVVVRESDATDGL